jgi:hypothetical protein
MVLCTGATLGRTLSSGYVPHPAVSAPGSACALPKKRVTGPALGASQEGVARSFRVRCPLVHLRPVRIPAFGRVPESPKAVSLPAGRSSGPGGLQPHDTTSLIGITP